MRRMHWLGPVALGLACLAVAACVELTGQRITWFHDAANDTLVVLVHYDGIHDSKNGEPAEPGAIADFVRDGDVMLVDWWGRLDMKSYRERAQRTDPLVAGAAKLVLRLRAEPLGHYREPDGRIGGLQRITISGISSFVKQANALFSQAVLQGEVFETKDLPRSVARMHEAARAGHAWFALRGHSIRFTLPVHPAEWARAKADGLEKLFREIFQDAASRDQEKRSKWERELRLLVHALTSAPFSYLDEGDRVTFILGCEDRPTTWRLPLRESYRPNLEKDVIQAAPTDLDRTVAQALLHPGDDAPTIRTTLLAWGPPEDQVRALCATARHDPEARTAALDRLAKWSEDWNRDVGVPRAPERTDDVEAWLRAWDRWYAEVVCRPVRGGYEDQSRSTGGEPQKTGLRDL